MEMQILLESCFTRLFSVPFASVPTLSRPSASSR